jgi:endonuclease/exonuclease/phosphatase family metal-dependent hydrolase
MALRTITYNVLQCSGFWSRDAEKRASRAFAPAEAAERFASALAPFAADIVTLCESPSPAVTEAIAARLGLACVTFPSPRDWPGTLMTSLEVLSVEHQPARAAEDVFTRHRGAARLRLDDGAELALHSAHLHPNDDAVRAREQRALAATIREDLEGGRSVLLQGDLNHRPEMPEYAAWTALGLLDAAAGSDEAAHSFRADLPMARIDYVWAGGALASRPVQARTLAEPPFTGVTGEADADPPLSDHLPVFAEFA